MGFCYEFRAGYRGSRKVKADVVASELSSLENTGDLTASRVIEVAEPENAPLHPEFEWDNAMAGHEYRLIQARTLIRAVVKIEELDGAKSTEPVSVYVHVPDEKGKEGKYQQLTVVIEDVDEYERALAEAQSDLSAAERRFYELQRVVEARGDGVEALAIAAQGFGTIRRALDLLKAS